MLGQVNLGCSPTADVLIESINATTTTAQACIDVCADTYHCNFVIFSDVGVGVGALKIPLCTLYETCATEVATDLRPSQAYQILVPKALPQGVSQVGNTGQTCGSGDPIASAHAVQNLDSCVQACEGTTACKYIDVVVTNGIYNCAPMKTCSKFKAATKDIERMYQVTSHLPKTPTPTTAPTTATTKATTKAPTMAPTAASGAPNTGKAEVEETPQEEEDSGALDQDWKGEERTLMIAVGVIGAALWVACVCAVVVNMVRRNKTVNKQKTVKGNAMTEMQSPRPSPSPAASEKSVETKAEIPSDTPLMPAAIEDDFTPVVRSPVPGFKAATRYDSSPAV
jgi:hypothetical protein